MPVRVFAMAALAAAAFAAPKGKVLPKDLPAYGSVKPVAAPKVAELRLENGMTVWLAPTPGFPKIAFALAIRGGYSGDPKERPGLADLLAATVTQGTSKESAKQIAEAIAAAGGDLSGEATPDAIYITTSVLAEHAGGALGLLSEIASSATFADQEVEIAKSNAASALEANEAEPGFLGRRALYRAMFGDHPYGIIAPTQDSIKQTTAAELRAEYAKRFRPDQALLVATGDFEAADLEKIIRADFGSWRSSSAAPPAEPSAPAYSTSRTVVYVPRPNSVQTALYLGTVAANEAQPDYAAAEVANAMYGGMFGSRLIDNIREDKGYTYSPGSRLVSRSQAGILATRADVRNPVTGASFNEITYELNRMATTAPEESEIDHARRYLLGSIAIRQQARSAMARSLANLWVSYLPPAELGALTEKISKVTAADVQAAGRKYFPASRMTFVAVGDEKVIKEELAPFGVEFTKAK
jgi:predicted Zn-dependent peptidase